MVSAREKRWSRERGAVKRSEENGGGIVGCRRKKEERVKRCRERLSGEREEMVGEVREKRERSREGEIDGEIEGEIDGKRQSRGGRWARWWCCRWDPHGELGPTR